MKLLCKINLHDWADWIQQVLPAGYSGYLWKKNCRHCDAAMFMNGRGDEWRA